VIAVLLIYLSAWSTVLLGKLIMIQLDMKFFIFMEPEDSLPHSQKAALMPYPQPVESTPHWHSLLT
jgi:hypothetical protein